MHAAAPTARMQQQPRPHAPARSCGGAINTLAHTARATPCDAPPAAAAAAEPRARAAAGARVTARLVGGRAARVDDAGDGGAVCQFL
jgi:hypothetical protein